MVAAGLIGEVRPAEVSKKAERLQLNDRANLTEVAPAAAVASGAMKVSFVLFHSRAVTAG